MVGRVGDKVHSKFGTRPYRVFTVRRTWSGGRAGLGRKSDVATELTPRPKLLRWLEGRLVPAGLDEDGEIVLAEVSLTLAEADLYPSNVNVAGGEEFFYRIDDGSGPNGGSGQGIASRLFVPARAPEVDRDRFIGWKVALRKYEGTP
jgi:hypothetical protein